VSFYFEPELKIWDIAAGKLLIEEAGGTVADLDGKPVDIFNFLTFIGGGETIVSEFLRMMK
jgi:myo-inositol-1(or 4)-monophosphatase